MIDMTPEHVQFEDGTHATFYTMAQLEAVRAKSRENYYAMRMPRSRDTKEVDRPSSVTTRASRKAWA